MFTLIPVILAGGEGKKLWPLSSSESPKQFLPIGKGGETLFSAAYKRALMLAPSRNVVVVTRSNFAKQTWREIREIDKMSKAQAILEPSARNTAAAISMAAIHALTHFENPILFIIPSDHYIDKPFSLINAVQESTYAAHTGKLVTFGITPSRADTNLSHVIYSGAIGDHNNLFGVKLFLEKAQGRRLEWLMQQKNCMWSSGMFMFSADAILKHIKARGRFLVDSTNRAYRTAKTTPYGLLADHRIYNNLPSISIDKLVMEDNKNIMLRPVDIGWSDVGTWQSLWELSQSKAYDALPLQKFLLHTQSMA